MKLDLNLKQYATDLQWKYLEAWGKYGSTRKAAKALDVSSSLISLSLKAVHRKAAKAGYAPDYDLTRPVPDGYMLKGASTYYGMDGEVRGQWIKSQVDKDRQAELFKAMMDGFTEELPRAKAVPLTPSYSGTEGCTSEHLMACYPIGDHHMGMLAWGIETGESYDMKIAERLLLGAIDHLVDRSPACDVTTIINLGDFMHYDSFEVVTPTSRNALDADSRYPKMVRYAIRSLRYTIERALIRHQHVNVITEIGNHDLSSSIFMMECLHNVYEKEPRVTIDTSPRHYHYFTHGKVLVGTHHGHGVKKLESLPLIMATDMPKEWGEAEFRYIWTGHIHHDTVKDIRGTKVESFRVLPPTDAWAAQKGYRTSRDMKCIMLHKEYGEVARYTVNPQMLEK